MEATWRWVALTAIAPVAWGCTYFVTRTFLPADQPLYGAVIRALPAGLLLLLACRALPRGSWWWKSILLGLLNMSAFFTLVYLAAQLLPTSVASVIMAMSPVVMMGLGWAVLSERPAAPALIGAGLGIAGVCAMLLTGGESVDLRGVLASVAAMSISSVGYVLAKKWSGQAPVLASTSWQLIAGGLLLLPFAVLVEGPPPPLNGAAVAGFAFVSIVGTAIAFAAWFTGLRNLKAGEVGLIGLLNPLTGVLLGTAVAAEALTVQQVGGIVLVLAGIALGQSTGRRRARNTAPPVELTRES
ncbi:DMT family transporter [Saccharopolyspora gloriosae]|uniref:DMT family transporter n=1 Tax=Saccharopolyspora gloriosae TaxID=455344 RepID=UPI001FB7B771|nr:EamA family transporter [Saccharopolyspora gloriosae]